MNIALSETKEYFEKLKKVIKCGTKNVATLNKFFIELRKIYVNFLIFLIIIFLVSIFNLTSKTIRIVPCN